MKEAAADLEFEEAARLRDEVKRLRETELAVANDPLAEQAAIENLAGSYAGQRKYGAAANQPKSKAASRPRKPQPGEMGPGSERTVPLRDVAKPAKTVDVPGAEVKKRRGRPRKTGRPGA